MKVFAFVISLLAFVGLAYAKSTHNHHDLKTALGGKLKTDGKHDVGKFKEHAVVAEVKGGKIVKVHVKHPKRGDVKVTMYKSDKKMAALDSNPAEEVPAQSDGGSIGFGFIVADNSTDQEIFWTPASLVADTSTAVNYVAPTD